MADEPKMANQAEQEKNGEIFYVDDNGDTKSRKAITLDDEEAPAEPVVMGTDPAAVSGGQPQFFTHKDAEKADGNL